MLRYGRLGWTCEVRSVLLTSIFAQTRWVGNSTPTARVPTEAPSESHTEANRTHAEVPENGQVSSRVGSGRHGHYNAAYHERLQRQRQRKQSNRPGARTTSFEEPMGEAFSRDGTLPMIHPGAKGLPPLEDTAPRKPKFSFLSDASQAQQRDYFSHGTVPNNTPKPLLPMWASSLTSPALGKQRLVEENWISMDSLGTVAAKEVAAFTDWLSRIGGGEVQTHLAENVELHLRKSFQRGVYARRDFKVGDVVIAIPLTSTEQEANPVSETQTLEGMPLWATALNAETLRRYSPAVEARGVPSYARVKEVLKETQSSDFDPIPHPLFVDQVHFALMLACEKAEGRGSQLYPYLNLFRREATNGRDSSVEANSQGDRDDDDKRTVEPLIDDEQVKELHLGVLDPVTHLEYNDHRNRFTHYLRELHKAWWDAYEAERQRRRAQQQGKSRLAVNTKQASGEEVMSEPGFTPKLKSLSEAGSHVDPLDLGDIHLDGLKGTASGTDDLSQTSVAASTTVVKTMEEDPQESEDMYAGLKPPPSLADMEWAFRFVLSRQRLLPGLRHLRKDELAKESTEALYEDENEKLDPVAKGIMRAKWGFYQHVLRAIDEDRLRVNDYDPSSIATVVPLFDMFNHPPNGQANVVFSVEQRTTLVPEGVRKLDTSGSETLSTANNMEVVEKDRAKTIPHLVVRATEDISAMDELTVLFPKCYSVSYSLYRYGFLPLRDREDDMVDMLKVNGVDGERNYIGGGAFVGSKNDGLSAGAPFWHRWFRKVMPDRKAVTEVSTPSSQTSSRDATHQ